MNEHDVPAGPRPPLEADLEEAARAVLPGDVYDFVAGGADGEEAVVGNQEAFRAYRLRPRVLRGGDVDLTTPVPGSTLRAPILVAPMGLQRMVHASGEPATAAAARRCGIGYALAMGSSVALEEVAGVAPPGSWFQVYVLADRGITLDLASRAAAAGYGALCVTVDVPVLGVRRRNRRNRFSPPPDVTSANLAPYATAAGPQRFASGLDAHADWSILEQIRTVCELPVVVKGLLTGDDTRRAVDHGASGVVVSNHGGRQLGRAVAPIDVLRECVVAADDRIAVFVDGGVRSAADIAVALALGATGVLVGRPVLWALAVGGEDGVAAYLDALVADLESTARLLGRLNPGEFDPSAVLRGGDTPE